MLLLLSSVHEVQVTTIELLMVVDDTPPFLDNLAQLKGSGNAAASSEFPLSFWCVEKRVYTLPRPVLFSCVLILSHSNEPASLSLDGRIITADIVNFQKRYDQDQSKVGAHLCNTIHWGSTFKHSSDFSVYNTVLHVRHLRGAGRRLALLCLSPL